MEFIGLGMKQLGANVNYIGARYHEDKDGVLLDYKDNNIGFQTLDENVDQFTMEIGEKDWQKFLQQRFAEEGHRLPDLLRLIATSEAFYAVRPAKSAVREAGL